MDYSFSQTQNTQRCTMCNSTDFYTKEGYYWCRNCQTQKDDIREDFYEAKYDDTTRKRKIRIRTEKTEEKDIVGWTSWELYNFVLIGLVSELVNAGANPSIKLTTLQLWTHYLTKLEVAYTSKTKKCVPKMARRYHKKDAEIIYGKIQQRKKKKRKMQASATSASSMSFMSETSNSTKELSRSKRLLAALEYEKYLLSQASSDTDGLSSLNQSLCSLKSSISQGSTNTKVKIRFNKKAKLESKKIKELSMKIPRIKRFNYRRKHVTTQYAMGPDCLTPSKLWSIIYLALRINNEDIYLSDMLRFSRESHLSYYKLDHLVPPEILLSKSDINLLTQTTDVTHKGLRRTAAGIAKFLNINELAKPDFLGLIKRYCQDLNLPRGISLYAKRLFLSSPSIMEFTGKSPLIPNYEGRAMAYVIVVMKSLFGLDDITEKEISRVVDKINGIVQDKRISASRLFSFCEWQGYLEGRKTVLATVHFPSKVKYDPERGGLSHLYLRFMGLMKSQRDFINPDEAPEITNHNRVIPQNLVDALAQTIDRINYNNIPMSEMKEFSPSLTPLRFYIDELDKENYEMPSLMRTKFEDTKIGYITKSDNLYDLATQCGIKLDVIDHSLHYLEKIVPPFEQPRIPTSTKMCESVKLEIPISHKNNIKMKSENLLDYAHRNRPCKLKVNFDNLKCYTTICDKIPEIDETLNFEEDSGFDQYLPDGRLNIPEDSGSEDEDLLDISRVYRSTDAKKEETEWADNKCLLNDNFTKAHNLKLYNHEKESILIVKQSKEKYVHCRDEKGKFVKSTARNLRASAKWMKKKEYKRIVDKSCDELSADETVPKMQFKKKELKKVNEENYNEDDSEDVQISSHFFELPEISILEDSNLASQMGFENLSITDNEILYRPFRDYWMYHCIFSRVKGKNFELFEKELPKNFLWLLNECADIVEMTTEDLYEEVCLVEAYHLNILKSKKSKGDSDYEFQDCSSKLYSNNIFNKW